MVVPRAMGGLYHPSWDAWRIEGQPGTPLATWEKHKHLKHTEVYQDWEEDLPLDQRRLHVVSEDGDVRTGPKRSRGRPRTVSPVGRRASSCGRARRRSVQRHAGGCRPSRRS